MFAVVLDTCVLWPSLQRDFLLSLAIEGLYRPLWSSAILAELEEHEARKLVRRGSERTDAAATAQRLVAQMSGAFDDACVQGWEPLEGTYDLPDPDDEHLVAAAFVGGAGAIVTVNFKDLPSDKVPAHIQVKAPAEFALETVEVGPDRALRAVEKMAGRRRRPPRCTVETILDTLSERYEMTAAVDLMRGVAT
ncbi:PIN domain-containing protein [Cellulosimicrobium cellulans]|uniref:PIN domain-containing protein n=1 Tax=Cellulosimicrobium cellulans TaxID=1710 RepID=A0A1Y0HVF2_CELCE|nr:PIN domain-containing protein [Cellulosimicrobium cellulans]ARU51496.1 PIN domain-containing protein [Cellulosimicrobium cellulans]